ncbi:protein phosphatase 1 regulatory subunit 3C-like [Dysidea avara]|uniref:protein phosphatase 1 regulatory subunit 3C-like n=1 Tax=Dysidea avara TaxID=196820 RepID=UPI0033224699
MALAELWISEAHVYPYHMHTVSARSIVTDVTDYEIMVLPTEKSKATSSEGNNFISFNGAHTHKNLLPTRRNGQNDSSSKRTERQHQFQRTKSKSFPSTEKKLKSCCKSKTSSPYRKQVHFADMFGYPLVKEFSYLLDQEIETFSKIEVQSFEWSQPEGLRLRNKRPDTATEAPKRTQPEVQFMFSQPSSEVDFFSKVEHNNVCLENMKREGPCIQGYIRVTNIAYHKKVQVRWTSDAWHSHHNIECVYSHTIQDSNTDCFSFKLPISGEQMELAIQYSVDGQLYWDNNGGRNYKITIKR